MTTFVTCGIRRIVQFDATSLLLERTLSRKFGNVDNEAVLWLCLMTAIWTWDEADWLTPRLRTVVGLLGIKTWQDARKAISPFPWIETMHEEPGHGAWCRALGTS